MNSWFRRRPIGEQPVTDKLPLRHPTTRPLYSPSHATPSPAQLPSTRPSPPRASHRPPPSRGWHQRHSRSNPCTNPAGSGTYPRTARCRRQGSGAPHRTRPSSSACPRCARPHRQSAGPSPAGREQQWLSLLGGKSRTASCHQQRRQRIRKISDQRVYSEEKYKMTQVSRYHPP